MKMADGPERVKGEVVLALAEEPAASLLRRWPTDRRDDLARRLGVCESPIEVLFALAMLTAKEPTGAPVLSLYRGATAGFNVDLLATHARFRFLAQHDVTLEGRNVRLDFALVPTGASGPKLAIELDGHDFHSSKQALESDASRDRALGRAGWTPIRFRGSEAWKNPDRCAAEAFEAVQIKVTPAHPVMSAEAQLLADCNAVFGDDVPIPLDATEQCIATARAAIARAAALLGSVDARDGAAVSLSEATASLDAIPPADLGRVLRAVVVGLRDDIAEIVAVLKGAR